MKTIRQNRWVRLLGVLLAVLLLVSTLPAMGLSASAAKMKGAFFLSGNPTFAYVVTGIRPEDADNTVKLYQNEDMQSYEGYTGFYTIPERVYDGEDMRYYTVTEIAGSNGAVFGAMENVGLQGIVLPGKLTTIGPRAFANCHYLTEIVFPTSVTTLATDAFVNASLSKLTLNVTAPATMASSGSYTPSGRTYPVFLPAQVTDMSVSAPLTVTGWVEVPGAVTMSNSGITVQTGGTLILKGSLSGAGVVEVRNGASFTMETPSPSYTGSIRLTGGSSSFTNRTGAPVTVSNAMGQALTVQPGETRTGSQAPAVQEPEEEPGQTAPAVPEELKPQVTTNYGGTVDVQSSGKVVVISAFTGYHVEEVVINGLPMGSITRYEFEAASGMNTVSVTFAEGQIPQGPAERPAFVDVPTGAVYAGAVNFLSNNGIFQGVTKTRFAPDEKTTRAMFLALLKRMEIYGEDFRLAPELLAPVPADVVEGSWYEQPVRWAISCGIVTPNFNWTVNPCRAVTREEAALYLYRYTKCRGYCPFVEASRYHAYQDSLLITGESRNALTWCATKGYLKTTDGMLDPSGTLTRAEVAQMLALYLQKN